MSIDFDVSLMYGCAIEGDFFELEETVIKDDRFELTCVGNWVSGNPAIAPFIFIRSSRKELAGKHEYPDFSSILLDDIHAPDEEVRKDFWAWFDLNHFKMASHKMGWHLTGSVS